ncbi:helix-turn-helix transcriptional regulator [Vogesella indigofera]|uniref:AraC family transcriptional regulator n=1 Tax=Vogesella indigofera TaxID=45465 RepID=UPI003F443EEE
MSDLPLFIFRSLQRQRLAQVPVLSTLLIAVEHGEKQLITASGRWHCPAGSWLVIPAGQTVEIVNQPAAPGGYHAWTLAQPQAWLQRLLAQYGPQLPALPWPQDTPVFRPAPAAVAELARLQALLPQAQAGTLGAARAEHAWQGLMLALAEAQQGADLFRQPRQDVSAQVQSLLAFDPARDWQAGDIAAGLAMSSATLRRKLAAEATSFSTLLNEVRMERALGLVNASQQALTQVAAACGYQSPSRFSAAFRQRFGVSPSQLRQQRDQPA